jgi:hypothetical protein
MDKFISRMIEESAQESIEAGQNKYRAYFINTKLYVKHQAKVDTKLIADGFKEVIVTK